MKKRKQPGENISLKTKKNEAAAVMDWINSQTNLMDSIRYLIENEIRLNGVRNLQRFVPPDRPELEVPLSAASAMEEAAAASISNTVQEEASPPAADEIDEEDIESWL